MGNPITRRIVIRPLTIRRTYCQAKTATAARIIIVILFTCLDGHVNNNYNGKFLLKRGIENIKFIINNDKNVIPDLKILLTSPKQNCNS